MEQALLLERLARAEKQVAGGRRRLNCQRELVLLIKVTGRDAKDEENLLQQLAATHAFDLAKLQRVKSALAHVEVRGDRLPRWASTPARRHHPD
jgi:hypothetical protein